MPVPAPAEQIESWLRSLCKPGGIYEMRCPKSGISGYYTDFSKLAEDARNVSLAGEPAVYLSLNATQDDMLERGHNKLLPAGQSTCDSDILARTRMLVDIDPVRPADCCSTDEEKAAAWELTRAVLDYLCSQGLPLPIVGDSGSGFHLIYRIGEPAHGDLIPRVLKSLSSRFSTSLAKVDTSVGNASRIFRIPGTVNAKGVESPSRPYRTSGLLDIPASFDQVSTEQLEKLAAVAEKEARRTGNLSKYFDPPEDRGRILKRAERYLQKIPGGVSGEHGHDATFTAAVKVVVGFGLTISEAIPLFRDWNQTHCVPPWSDEDIDRKVTQAFEKGDGVRGEKADQNSPQNGSGQNQNQSTPRPRFDLGIIDSRTFNAAVYKREYLIKNFLVANEPCLWGGPAKALKTSVMLDGAVSLGSATPFLGRFQTKKCNVLVISGESGEMTLRAKARAIAEARNIDFDTLSIHWGFTLPHASNLEHRSVLRAALEELAIDVVFLDPAYLMLMAGAGGAKSPGDVFAMGELLLSVSSLVKDCGATLVLLHHFKKPSQIQQFSRPELTDLTFSGFAEFARQWVLVSRRDHFSTRRDNKLWLVSGGSAGHGGCWELNIDEGEHTEDGTGELWAVEIETDADARIIHEHQKGQSKEEKRKAEEQSIRLSIVTLLDANPDGLTVNAMTRDHGINRGAARVLFKLAEEGIVEPCKITVGNGQKRTGYKRTDKYRSTEQTPQTPQTPESGFVTCGVCSPEEGKEASSTKEQTPPT